MTDEGSTGRDRRPTLPQEENPAWRTAERPPAFPRDEVVRAIERRGDCRIPQIFEPVPLFFRNEGLYDFFAKWPNDVMYANVGLDPRGWNDLMTEDQMVMHGSSAVRHALEDWSQVDEVSEKFFRPLSDEWKNGVRAQVAMTPGYYHMVLHVALLFETAYVLRGMERFFLDLHEHRDEVESFLDRVLEYTCDMMRAYGEVGVDGVFIGVTKS